MNNSCGQSLQRPREIEILGVCLFCHWLLCPLIFLTPHGDGALSSGEVAGVSDRILLGFSTPSSCCVTFDEFRTGVLLGITLALTMNPLGLCGRRGLEQPARSGLRSFRKMASSLLFTSLSPNAPLLWSCSATVTEFQCQGTVTVQGNPDEGECEQCVW